MTQDINSWNVWIRNYPNPEAKYFLTATQLKRQSKEVERFAYSIKRTIAKAQEEIHPNIIVEHLGNGNFSCDIAGTGYGYLTDKSIMKLMQKLDFGTAMARVAREKQFVDSYRRGDFD